MDADPDDPRVGLTLDGRYRIIARISQGSMGVVYRAERVKLGRAVAVKFLHGSFATEPQFVGRFEREARAMSRLAHPNCVSVIDVGMTDAPYVVMEFVTGETLRALLDRGPVPVVRAVPIAKQILAGLAHAHGLGIVHRDIKPANVMLTEATGTGDHVRLLDFGLATLLGGVGTSDLSQSNIVVGTPSYMAPEQSRGDKVDGKADVYATAVVLFELLTGKKPFNADSSLELIRLHREMPPPRVSAIAPALELPPRLEDLVHQGMRKDPTERPTAIEMSRALEQIVRATGAMPAMPVPEAEATAPSAAGAPRPSTAPTLGTRIRRAARIAVPLLVVAGFGFTTWALVTGDRGTRKLPSAPSPRAARREPPLPPAETAPPPSLPRGALAPHFDDAGPDDDAGVAEELTFTTDRDGGEDPDRDAGVEPPIPADEQDEPVPALPDTAAEAAASEPSTVAELDARPAAKAPPAYPAGNPLEAGSDRADTIDEARALIKAGRAEEAIAALRLVRVRSKKSAYAPYLLGNLYFEKQWWTVGMESYREAIGKNRVYRTKAVLNRNVIRALGDRRTVRAASSLIYRSIGRAALPFLDQAARSDRNKIVRQRAAEVARQLRRRR